VLSSGQTKVVAAALRLASLTDVEEHRGERFPVVIDDVDAELDPRVLSRLIGRLEGERQLLLSSAIGAVSGQLGERAKRYLVSDGTITEQAGERAHE
jgi:recombinational DNA repair ATPase RecF